MQTIGIDLGTTNSIVATSNKGIVRTLQIDANSTIPSVVYFKENGCSNDSIIVGRKAKSQLRIHPDKTVRSFKRFMGDINKTWNLSGNKQTPVDIASHIIKKIKQEASKHLDEHINDAVITVPAYFNTLQKSRTKQAAEKAGLNVLDLLKEPTAAAIAYGLNKEKDQTIMVYDLGGGTFDVTILEIKGNKFIEKAIDGDSFLGGDDFDEIIKRYMVNEFENSYKSFILESADEKKLMEYAESIKLQLSYSKRVEETIILSDGKYTLDIDIKLKLYQSLIQDHIDRTINILYRALKKAKLDKDDINRIILVGGSTNSPLVFERLAEEIKKPHKADNVDEIVAHGAAILANSLTMPVDETRSCPIELEKITPFNLGVKATDDVSTEKFSIIIPDQTPIPCSRQRSYTTDYDNQNSVPIGIFQGFGKTCTDPGVHFIGGFILDGIPDAPQGVPNIDINFSFNGNDLLDVSAYCSGVGSKAIQLNVNETSDPNDIYQMSGSSAVVLCIDGSGSMSGKPIEQAIKAACAYVELKFRSKALIGCTVFASSAATIFSLSNDVKKTIALINTIDSTRRQCGYGTNMEKGLHLSIPMLTGVEKNMKKQIIVLSDGYTSGNVRELIPVCIQNSIIVHTVGAGGGYDRALLEELSTKTGGIFVAADNIDHLIDAFISLAEK